MIAAAPRPDLPARPAPEAALVRTTGAGPVTDLAEIGRRAVHLAALERVVLPMAEGRITNGDAKVKELRRCGRELATALHWLDRHFTGDSRAATWWAHDLSEAVRTAAAVHARSERALVAALAETLDYRELIELARSYHRVSLTAPTRPHPRLAWRGIRSRLAFMLTARIDGLRDVLDNRAVRFRVQASAVKALRDLDLIPAAANPGYVLVSATMPSVGEPAAALA